MFLVISLSLKVIYYDNFIELNKKYHNTEYQYYILEISLVS